MPAARGAGAAATAGAAEVEERVRRELRSELAVRDARAKAAEQELAELGETLAQTESRNSALNKQQAALRKQCGTLTKAAAEGTKASEAVTRLEASLADAMARLAAAEGRSAEFEGLAANEARARAEEKQQQADAAAAAELERRNEVARRVIQRVLHMDMARAFTGWSTATAERKRLLAVVRRAALRFSHSLLSRGFSAWAEWAARPKVDPQAALDKDATQRRQRRADKALRRMGQSRLARALGGWEDVTHTAVRHRKLLRRSARYLRSRALVVAFELWHEWAAADTVRARLAAAEEAVEQKQEQLSALQKRHLVETRRCGAAMARAAMLSSQLGGAEKAGTAAATAIKRLRAELEGQGDQLVAVRAGLTEALADSERQRQRADRTTEQLALVTAQLGSLKAELRTEREENSRAEAQAEEERLRLAAVATEADAAAAKDRTTCAAAETETQSLQESLATLSRTQHYYARQLALLSRQHAAWVSSVSLPSIDTSSAASPAVAASARPMTPNSAHAHSASVDAILRQDMQTFLMQSLKLGTAESADATVSPDALLSDWKAATRVLTPVHGTPSSVRHGRRRSRASPARRNTPTLLPLAQQQPSATLGDSGSESETEEGEWPSNENVSGIASLGDSLGDDSLPEWPGPGPEFTPPKHIAALSTMGRPRTRDRPRDMLEGVIETTWEQVHSDALQWASQASDLARLRGETLRVGEENTALRRQLAMAQGRESPPAQEHGARTASAAC